MCGRLSQYSSIHDFVAALSMPNALANTVGDEPLGRYNVAPTTQVAPLHLEGDTLHADRVRWGWRPHWAKDRAAPINVSPLKLMVIYTQPNYSFSQAQCHWKIT